MSTLVGIDLGTTNSVIAVMDRAGRPEIVANREGARTTPSFVFFEPGETQIAIVGQHARDAAIIHPDRVFHSFKRQMATQPELRIGEQLLTPAGLSAMVLRKLVQDASAQVGPISAAVITVPANFANEARTATISSGQLAGLVVTHIINEPTAALFYYSYTKEIGGTVLVYDFGGGTLDVTIAHVNGREVEIVSSKGDPRLGGIDFDARMQNLISQKFLASTGDVFDPSVHSTGKTVEEYKQQLSIRADTSVQVTGGRSGRVILKISRREFEDAASTLIAKADLLVESALDETGLHPRDISGVFLVGGSTRMPMVQEHLTRVFGYQPTCHANPDEVVALGAALYAGFRAGEAELNPAQASAVRSMKLQEVANHFFGTLAVTSDPQTGRSAIQNSTLIEKNTKLPCEVTREYLTTSENQTTVDCSVTQSSTREIDSEFVRIIWRGPLGPLPPGRPANMPIRVTYSYDSNQVMRCKFEDVKSGLVQLIDVGVRDDKPHGDANGIDRFLVE